MNKEENPLHYKFAEQFHKRYHEVYGEVCQVFNEADWVMRLNVETLYALHSEPEAIQSFFNPTWRQGQKTWRGILVRTDNTIPVGEAVFEYKQ